MLVATDIASPFRAVTGTWSRMTVLYNEIQAGVSRRALLEKDLPNLSPAVISRLTAEWQGEQERWQKRDLSARHLRGPTAYSCRRAWKTTASACWCSSADAGRQEGTRLVNREAPDLGSFCRN